MLYEVITTPVNSDYLVLGNYNTITDDGNSTFTPAGHEDRDPFAIGQNVV